MINELKIQAVDTKTGELYNVTELHDTQCGDVEQPYVMVADIEEDYENTIVDTKPLYEYALIIYCNGQVILDERHNQ